MNQSKEKNKEKVNKISNEKVQIQFIAELKHCPACSIPTVKTGGCDTMKCSSCKTKWCWQCLLTKPKAHRHPKP